MSLHAIAYHADEHLLLTLDGSELLAHDAQTEAPKWRLTFAHPLVAVLFAAPGALPLRTGATPWRDASVSRCIIAVDAEGSLHAVDPLKGEEIGALGPFGKPLDVAAGAGGRLALATDSRVLLWREGEAAEIAGRVSALAFSNDGATLALGAADGSLRFFSAAPSPPPAETFCAVVHGGVFDLVQHPGGAWLVAGKTAIYSVTASGPQRLESTPAGVSRLQLDASGGRLAAQLSDRAVTVYAWPSLQVEMQIEYTERLVRGLAFGPGSWLGLGLDHGDGNKIDVLSADTHRTDTHPGRTHRSWLLSVRGKQLLLSAKEAEEIRRMKTPFHVPEPSKSSGNGGRIGIGVGISLAVLCLRLCLIGSRASSSSYSPPTFPTYPSYDPGALSGLTGTKCDRACVTLRLELLRDQCGSNPGCYASANAAVAAFAGGNCRRAKDSIARIGAWSPSDPHAVVGRAALSLAQKGLAETCLSLGSSTRHAKLVRLEGPTLAMTVESIPEASPVGGEEEPRAIWAAPDGTLFVSTITDGGNRSLVHRRDKTGLWDVIARRRSTDAAQLWGRSATDLYIADVDSLAHFDGTKTTEIAPPGSSVLGIGGIGEDVFVAGDDHLGQQDDPSALTGVIHRRHGVTGGWSTEPTLPKLVINHVWTGGATLWARASASDDEDGTHDQLLQRGAGGRWSEKKLYGPKPPSEVVIRAVWASPSGDAFVATDDGVFRSAGAGASWTKTNDVARVDALWGRSSTDVYASTDEGLMHYDGKAWSPTSYAHRGRAVLGGTASVLLVAAVEDD